MGSFTVASKTEVEDSGTEAVFVFVNGLFGGGISKQTRKYLRERFPRCRFISLHCGAVSSVRDRAVECFWQLRGGTTDYQVDGELEYGHGRYGETYPGLLKEWSDERPIHIIAYSLGASTARCLQHLLERRAFCDAHDQIPTSGAWIRSLVTLHGCNQGSIAVHAVGLSPWSLQPLPLSILWWIFTVIYCIVWLDNDVLNRACGLRLRHWKAQRRKTSEDTEGISLARLLWWRPGGADNAGRDLSPKRMSELNTTFAQTLPHAATTYIACYGVAFAPATVQTQQSLAGLLSRFLLSVVPSTDANVADMLMRTHPKPTALSAAAGAQECVSCGSVARLPSSNSSDSSLSSVSLASEEELEANNEAATRMARVGASAEASAGGGQGQRGAGGARVPVLAIAKALEAKALDDTAALLAPKLNLERKRSGIQVEGPHNMSIQAEGPHNMSHKRWEGPHKRWLPQREHWRTHAHAAEEFLPLGEHIKSEQQQSTQKTKTLVSETRRAIAACVSCAKRCLRAEAPAAAGRVLAYEGYAGGARVGRCGAQQQQQQWNDDEANDGVLSVAAQKAPAMECNREVPREFDSVASLRAALIARDARAAGASGAGAAAAPRGAWTQVWMGWHDHIDITQDGVWQREWMRELCVCVLLAAKDLTARVAPSSPLNACDSSKLGTETCL